jgi:hypothetical protein
LHGRVLGLAAAALAQQPTSRVFLSLWIGFALDSAPAVEIGFRTAMTSGGYAHAAQLLSSPMVRTVNGLVGDVALAAGSNVTITPSGSTLTIGATTGLATVSRDATLLGDGTSGAPLGVAAPLRLRASTPVGESTIDGTNSAGIGVRGTSSTNAGVVGVSTSYRGVFGQSNTSLGVGGLSTSGVGVFGQSISKYRWCSWGRDSDFGRSGWGLRQRDQQPWWNRSGRRRESDWRLYGKRHD